MLNSLQYFQDIVFLKKETMCNGYLSLQVNFDMKNLEGEMYCPKCGGKRRMNVTPIFINFDKNSVLNTCMLEVDLKTFTDNTDNEYINSKGKAISTINEFLTPSLWEFKCLQCKTTFTALVYKGSTGEQSLAVFPSCHGGVSTPNTPDSVAYYLSQANLSRSVSANSAAMSMYRAALEQILFEQGYTDRMLGPKINHLCKDIENGNAPDWALKLETEFLTYLNKLGNGAIHANDGDVEKQKSIDNELLTKIDVLFSMLLYRIYEAKKQQADWLNALNSTASIFDK